MKVYKVADIVNREITFCRQTGYIEGDVCALLTNLESVQVPRPDSEWKLDLVIGKGKDARHLLLDLPPQISIHDSLDYPLFLGADRLVFFKDRLFMPERPLKSDREREKIILRVKKLVFDEETEFSSLRAAVANLEAAIEYSRSGPKRDPIPEDVKLLVWARDGGACERCGSKQELHFDHIIPVVKGGGNSAANIQILCQNCNLKKSDKIATV